MKGSYNKNKRNNNNNRCCHGHWPAPAFITAFPPWARQPVHGGVGKTQKYANSDDKISLPPVIIEIMGRLIN